MTDITLQNDPIILKFLVEKLRRYADILSGLEDDLANDKEFYTQVVKPLLDVVSDPNAPGGGTDDQIIDGLVTVGRAQLDAKDMRDLAKAIGDVLAVLDAIKPLLIKASVNPINFFGSAP